MISAIASTPSTRLIKPVCFALCAAFLILASRGLLSGYSYWLDEIYSVSASLDTWQQLYQRWILQSDVHPPLYQIFLKLWMLLLGSSEIATRLLSFIFSLITLSAFSFDAIAGKRWRRVIALILIGASPSFAYYAQETRSYSLVLALSSVVTLSLLELRARSKEEGSSTTTGLTKVFYAGALLLSLTHYFGWIYVFVILLINCFEQRIEQARSRAILLLSVMSLWPIWHVVVGALANKTGGEFWIRVGRPVLGTVAVFLDGSLPFLADRNSPLLYFTAVLLLAAFMYACVFRWESIRSIALNGGRPLGAIADEMRFVSPVILLFVAILALVDIHTPMSTPRNYIVLLPAVMIALANSLTMIANLNAANKAFAIASLLLVLSIAVSMTQRSWIGLSDKGKGHQNWKGLAAYLRQSNVCSEECFAIGSYGLHPYYFEGLGVIDDLSIRKAAEDQPGRSATLEEQVDYVINRPDARILGFHMASQRVPELMRANPNRVCIQPQQSWPNSTYLILPKRGLTGKEAQYGMRKCA
jgi:hypothetical protein